MPKFLIALLVIVALLIFTAFFIIPKSSSLSPSPSPQPLASNNNSELLTTVNNFYQEYQSCMANPPNQAEGSVSTWCQANNSFATKDFAKNLANGGVAKAGADPILCAQNPPQSVKAETVTDPNTVKVVEQFGVGVNVNITVNLVTEKNQPKVNNITCPTP
jgi:hypothetical protein